MVTEQNRSPAAKAEHRAQGMQEFLLLSFHIVFVTQLFIITN